MYDDGGGYFTFKKCPFCHKVFAGHNFLASHISRRHPEHLEELENGTIAGARVTMGNANDTGGPDPLVVAKYEKEIELHKQIDKTHQELAEERLRMEREMAKQRESMVW